MRRKNTGTNTGTNTGKNPSKHFPLSSRALGIVALVAVIVGILLVAGCTPPQASGPDDRCSLPKPAEVGLCKPLLGWYYDAPANSCKPVSGCSAEGEIPFQSAEDCRKQCVVEGQEDGGEREDGANLIAFEEIAGWDIGSITEKSCVVMNSAEELAAHIEAGGPAALQQLGIDFNALTLVGVYAGGGAGSGMAVTRVLDDNVAIFVEYLIEADPERLQEAVYYSPNAYITIPKTDKPVICLAEEE